jgi:hypothetical protein
MSDDARWLSAAWMSEDPAEKADVTLTIEAVLDRDRAEADRDRRTRIGSLVAVGLLLPVVLWAAAHGVTPLVRGAYALMAIGLAVIVTAEWLYLEWSKQALPGPVDARSQLQKTAFMLTRQARLLTTAAMWSSPVFIGAALIGAWLYRERTHTEAIVVWAITAAGWLAMGLGTVGVGARLTRRREQLERLLAELD